MPLAFFSLSGSWAQLLSQIWFIRLKRTQREIWFKTWFLYLVSLPSKWKDATYSHKKKKKKNQNFTKWLTPNQIISAVRIERKKRFGGDLWRRRSRYVVWILKEGSNNDFLWEKEREHWKENDWQQQQQGGWDQRNFFLNKDRRPIV